ncbi:Rieske (2Fe-2S) protein [Cytobacillus oceanisediminis]|uniref:Rieske (2Fe-2S) protein n=1 Tax=Cytobacillus oceanisediminis TaxID=665099 RepID=UPI00203FF5C3|nr:Rieske (2Fe-2S) protein [Cytobacillus oceanisediminis]MCM3403189.1 Rieske (2Fe-2S) protein [Cytobacillus oceanisediminis]MDK7666259.1 Rieske (2Fe-2S) protein [Cytobacillus oceanisediminis]
MNKHVVATVSELPIGSHKVVKVGSIEIGIFNVENEFYALKSVCPHQQASLCKGVVDGTNLHSDAHQYIFGRDGEILRCPWHNWEFDIKTGCALFDNSLKVASYKVTQDGDNLVLHMKK